MAAEVLPPFSIHELKDSVPIERFNLIASNVARKLAFILRLATKSDKPLQAQPFLGFLSSYLGDVARQKLSNIASGINTPYNDSLSDSERAIRKHALHLIRSLASQQQPISGILLVDLAVSYSPLNSSVLREIFRMVLSIPAQASEFTSYVVPAFTTALLAKHPDVTELREVAHVLMCVTGCGDEVVGLFAREPLFVKALVECYQSVLPKLAKSLGGIHLQGTRSTYEIEWVETKVDLLDSYNNLVQTLVQSPQTVGRALEIISEVFDAPNSLSTNPTPFLDTNLNDDLNRVADLPGLFKNAVPSDDPRLEVMVMQLRPMTSKNDVGALTLLPATARSFSAPAVEPRIDKGKGKQTAAETKSDSGLDALVTQVLDILSDQNPSSIRAALQLPRFNRSAEALISALLEGEQLPEPPIESEPISKPAAAPKLSNLSERRNVFDDDEMDYSRLRIGKKRSENADTVLRDKAFIAAQKADILRRAAEISDPESEWKSDEEKKPAAVAFFDDDEDGYAGAGAVNDGEGSNESASEDGEEDGEDIGPEAVLEVVWLEGTQVFDRDAATRRSKARIDLKSQTGWSDEQIEGWKSMLDRDPRRQARIREKHEFKGNQPTLVQSVQYNAPRGRGRGGPGRSGRGRGTGGGGGGGEGGEGGSARDRASKDKNKAHRGNHDRKRGHDKKMARGGFPS